MHRSYALALGLLLLTLIPAPVFAEGEPRTVGYLLPLTGDAAVFGDEVKRGLEIARKELQESGTNVRLVFEDEQCMPRKAVTGWRKLAQVDRASVIVGPGCTGSIMATAPLAQRVGRPLFALWDAGREVASAGDHVFAIGFDSEKEGELLASYLLAQKQRRVAILWEEDKFAELIKDSFSRSFKKGGGVITSQAGVGVGEQDLGSVVTRLAGSNPDAMFVSPAYSAVAALKAIHRLGFKKPVYGQDTFSFPGILEAAGSAMDGLVYANAVLSADSPAASKLEQKYKQRFGEKPTSLAFAAFGYDSLKIAVALPDDSARQSEALKRVKWKGALPFERFGEARMLRLPPSLFIVQDGQVAALPEEAFRG